MIETNPLFPPRLAAAWQQVRSAIPSVRETFDRRGFRLLQWDSKSSTKPFELSLEHEARLEPATPNSLSRLMDALAFSEERTLGELLLPGDKQFGALVVKSYNRDPGPQSIDLYYDWTDPLRPSLIEQQVTVRERIRTSKFMTWSSDESDARPLNLELPFADLGGGLTARLEFNWIDDLNSSVEDSLQPDSPSRIFNPFYHVWQHLGLVAGELSPLIEHTTTRKKFGVSEPNGKQVFAINIDFVAARKISKNQTASAVDVDISGVHPIDEMEWARLHAFATRLSFAFELKPNLRTKASKDQFLFNG